MLLVGKWEAYLAQKYLYSKIPKVCFQEIWDNQE